MNESSEKKSSLKIAIEGSFNLELLKPPLREAFLHSGIITEIYIGGYTLYPQEILSPGSPLYNFNPDVILLLLHTKDIFSELYSSPLSLIMNEEEALALAYERSTAIINYVEQFLKTSDKSYILITTLSTPSKTPLGSLTSNISSAYRGIVHSYNKHIIEFAKNNDRVFVIDTNSIILSIGEKDSYDYRMWYLARCIWSREFVRLLGKRIVQLWKAIRGEGKKCLVLDLDNTLWGGIIGEDGIGGIALGGEGPGFAYKEFQQNVKVLKDRGILLAINSKNNYDDVKDVFEKHPEMILKESDFAAQRINWRDKVDNMKEIAEELNIGIDSFVFIDDNPVEREIIKRCLPDIVVPDFPPDISSLSEWFIEICCEYFNSVRITKEDIAKSEQYRVKKEIEKLKITICSKEEFLKSLEMTAVIRKLQKEHLHRIAQLTQKTNQFNLTTKRYTEADIEAIETGERGIVFSLQLIDKFTDNGIIGVVIYTRDDGNEKAWWIDTLLLSCRVIGREIEKAFISYTAQVLKKEKGAEILYGEYIPTPKNKIVSTFYEEMGFSKVERKDERNIWAAEINTTITEIPEFIRIKSEV